MPSAPNTTNILTIDPGLPKDDPTVSFWQQPLHQLASVKSESLPTRTDVLIIGSGMTACSAAKTILEESDTLTVIILEARGLASGASSRNGGHIVSPSFGDFEQLIETFGVQSAVEIAEFTLNNVDATFDAVRELRVPGLEESSEIRRTEKVLGLEDNETLQKLQTALQLWNQHMPGNRRAAFKFIDASEAESKYGLKNVVGAAVGEAAAVWPYKLWAGIWAHLFETYAHRLRIETYTPALKVTEVAHTASEDRYLIETPRGVIEASHILYATNAYTPHLLPSLQSKMFPVRGTMSTQDLGTGFANHGLQRSWSFLSKSKFDTKSGTANAGLYYLTQNPHCGFMFLGGEHDAPKNIISSDDRELNPESARRVAQLLPQVFEGVDSSKHKVLAIWSGIMGFSNDGVPLVGNLPEFVTSRRGQHEWIAAGFNGYGTGYCFLCGKAVAQMILGKDVEWLPTAFLVTKNRFSGSLRTPAFWEDLVGSFEGVV